MKDKILPFALLGGLGYMVLKPKTTYVKPIEDTVTTASNTGPGGLQTAGGSGAMVAVSGIEVSSRPDYKTWSRSHWAEWSRVLLQNNGLADAKRIVWAAWRSPENEFADKFATVDPLFYFLVAYQKDSAVGNFNIDENSAPMYDTWTAYVNGLSAWECPDWRNWFDAMAAAWGNRIAIQKFTSAWSFADNWSLGSNGWTCSQTCNFIDEMEQRGIDVADTGMRTICNFTNIPYNLVTAGENVSQGVNNATSTAASVAPLLIYGAVAFLGVKAYQSINQ